MEKITTLDFFIKALNFVKGFKKKSVSNYYFNSLKNEALINSGDLSTITIGEVVFILKQNEQFTNLYYYAADLIELRKSLDKFVSVYSDMTFIVDVVTTEIDTDVLKVFNHNGFNVYTSLVRMSRIFNDMSMVFEVPDQHLKVANQDESLEVFNQLKTFFDPKAEQLPTQDEMIEWSNKGYILVYKIKNLVVGFIVYQLVGVTLYLRYWFVSPLFRERKLGSKLFNYFLLKGKDSKRQLFWVIQTNENAIIRYKHYGFKEEKMYNFVLTNKNIKYEG
jgi:ribosomal protein S18 acetylase RimI-like enzyme